jgi:hypothetical protein
MGFSEIIPAAGYSGCHIAVHSMSSLNAYARSATFQEARFFDLQTICLTESLLVAAPSLKNYPSRWPFYPIGWTLAVHSAQPFLDFIRWISTETPSLPNACPQQWNPF